MKAGNFGCSYVSSQMANVQDIDDLRWSYVNKLFCRWKDKINNEKQVVQLQSSFYSFLSIKRFEQAIL